MRRHGIKPGMGQRLLEQMRGVPLVGVGPYAPKFAQPTRYKANKKKKPMVTTITSPPVSPEKTALQLLEEKVAALKEKHEKELAALQGEKVRLIERGEEDAAIAKIKNWAASPVGHWVVFMSPNGYEGTWTEIGVFSGHVVDVVNQFANAKEPKCIAIKKAKAPAPRTGPIQLQLSELFKQEGYTPVVTRATLDWLVSQPCEIPFGVESARNILNIKFNMGK